MLLRALPKTALALAVSLALPLAAQQTETPDLDQVVATVAGIDITLGHLAAAKATLPDQYRNLPADVLFPGILDQLIQQTALSQSFQGDMPKRIQLALDNETRSLMAGEVVEGVLAAAVTPELLEERYRAQFSSGPQGEEYKAAHILVETEEEANQVKADLDEGADFAQTARDKSTGPSGPRGGDLGWFGTGVMVPEFEAAVIALKPGEVSQPIQTQFGWHVIQLNETRIKEAPALAEVQEQLEGEIRQEAVRNHIDALLESTEIDRSMAEDIDPAVLDQIDLTQNP